MQHTAKTTKHAIDAMSVFTAVGTLSDLLASLGNLLTNVHQASSGGNVTTV